MNNYTQVIKSALEFMINETALKISNMFFFNCFVTGKERTIIDELAAADSNVKQAHKLRLYDGSIINLDFHTIPHFGVESLLQKHWAGARNKK